MLGPLDKEKIQATLGELGGLATEAYALNKNFISDDFKIIYALARALYQKGDIVEARPIFERLISLKPFEADYWVGLALCWQKGENYTEALKAWTVSTLLDDKSPLFHFHMVECYLALGNGEEGSKSFAACQKRLRETDDILRKKLENLSVHLAGLAQKEA